MKVIDIVANADDFGMNPEVNQAVAECFSKGFITNTTIMANMPSAREAVDIAKEEGFFDRVGLHLNVTQGEPLSQAMRECDFFVRCGEFSRPRLSLIKRVYGGGLPLSAQKALREEAKAQISWYLNEGFDLAHMDSHMGVCEQYSILYCVLPEFKKAGLKTMRLRTFLPEMRTHNKLYSLFINAKIPNPIRRFYDGAVFLERSEELASFGNCELMFHPTKREGCLMDVLSGKPCSSIADIEGVRLISYRDCR